MKETLQRWSIHSRTLIPPFIGLLNSFANWTIVHALLRSQFYHQRGHNITRWTLLSNSIEKIHLCAWGFRREFHLDVISLVFFPFFYDKCHKFFLKKVLWGYLFCALERKKKRERGGSPPGGSQISHGFHNFSGSVS